MNDKEKEAYALGYSAGWDMKMGNVKKCENPFNPDKQFDLFLA